MTEQPIDPKRPANSATATVILPCPKCKEKKPHYSKGAAHNSALGEQTQAMVCSKCGTMTDVPTKDFQANVDTPDSDDDIILPL